MATSIISRPAKVTSGTATSNQTGASCTWERIGNIVTVNAVITKPNTSWNIFTGLPSCATGAQPVCIGLLATSSALVYPVFMYNGSLQIRASTFSDTYYFAGSYLTG